MIKNVNLAELNVGIATIFMNFKHDLIEYKYLHCNNNYQEKFDERWKEQYFHIYYFSNHDNNKSILLMWKGVYPYEYMIGKNSIKHRYLKKIITLQLLK